MRKKYSLYLFVFFFFFICKMNFCYALMYNGQINGTGVYLRTGPGTNYSTLKTLNYGATYTLVNNTLYPSEKDCRNGWYKLYYEDSATGYVCSDYVNVRAVEYNMVPTNDCEKSLQSAGFPASYWPGICSLKENHPNWQFNPLFTNLDWSSAVDNESACGISFIASSIPTNIDNTCRNPYTKTWYPASSSAVAYYMDPRNFLTEQYIFQFEYLKYDNNLKDLYVSAVTDVIDQTEFYKYHKNLGNSLPEIINDASKAVDVSPIFIASRIRQELGNGTSLYNLYSGVYTGYQNYYNFYNFGVTDSCATSKGATVCGLEYAKTNKWQGLLEAIQGGAGQIASSYIAKGQYTGYLQKYNVVPTEKNKLYTHQYMTNIEAPSSESKTTYNTYKERGLINNVFSFYIPVYNNMDDSDYSPNSGAVDSPTPSEPTNMPIETIVVSSGYTYSQGNISGIKANTSIQNLKSSLESIAGSDNVKITDASGTLVTDGMIGTGYKVTIQNAEKSETLTVVIYGDTSGDGQINALDLLQIQKSILGTYNLKDAYNLAGDTSGDSKINALDLLQVQKSILGTYEIRK